MLDVHGGRESVCFLRTENSSPCLISIHICTNPGEFSRPSGKFLRMSRGLPRGGEGFYLAKMLLEPEASPLRKCSFSDPQLCWIPFTPTLSIFLAPLLLPESLHLLSGPKQPIPFLCPAQWPPHSVQSHKPHLPQPGYISQSSRTSHSTFAFQFDFSGKVLFGNSNLAQSK